MNEDIVYLINFLPNIGSTNLGDYIIVDAIEKVLYNFFKKNNVSNVYIINIATHQPLSKKNKKIIKKLESEKNVKLIKIVSGTNLFHLYYTPFSNLNLWNVGIFDIKYIKNVVLFGVGTSLMDYQQIPPYKKKIYDLMNIYSRYFWKRVLNKNKIHIVRDSKSVDILKSLGLRGINLGCPTLWTLTDKHCQMIPKKKSDMVVTTLTDYSKDPLNDYKLIKILTECYDKVFIWPQGTEDYMYAQYLLKKLDNFSKSKIHYISPTLKSYDEFLSKNNVDYIGTRLHAGIRALQYQKRTIIISIDNRAKSFNKDFNIPVVDRNKIDILKEKIFSSFRIKLILPSEEEINYYLKQLFDFC
jgi:polysaccharide pyruvyl transferase WcaK-like protein